MSRSGSSTRRSGETGSRDPRRGDPSANLVALIRTLESALAAPGDGLCLLDWSWRFLYVNDAAAAMAGKAADGLIGRDVTEMFPQLADSSVLEAWAGAAASRLPARIGPIDFDTSPVRGLFEFLLWPLDGGLLLLARRYRDASGIGAELDRTHEDSLVARRLAAAIDQTSESVVMTDPDATITYVNPAFERVTGYSRAEAVGQNARILQSGAHTDAFYADLWRTLASGEPWTGEIVNRRKDGSLFTEEASIIPVRDPTGAVAAYVAVKRDVTAERRARQELRRSEERLRVIQLMAGVAGWSWDAATDTLDWADEMYPLYGRDRALGPPTTAEVAARYGPGSRERVDAAAAHTMATGEPFVVEIEVYRGDGSLRAVEDRGEVVRDESGRIVGMHGTVVDLTERSRAERALRESEARYRSLFESMHEGLAYCRMLYVDGRPDDWVYLEVNDAFGRQTGLADVAGRRASEVIPGIRETDPELIATYGRVASGGPPERFETYVAALDMWFSISAYSPAPEHFVAVFDVITDRKRTEAALRASEDLHRTVVESLAEGVIVEDADGVVVAANARARAILGVSSGAIPGAASAGLAWGFVDESGAPMSGEAHPATITRITGRPCVDQVLGITRSDGRRIWVRLNTRPLFDESGAVAGVVGSFADITREREIEHQVREAQRLEAIGRLAGGVAHDFNNLLMAIFGAVEMLAGEHGPDDPHQRDLRSIREAAERAAALTRQLLALGRSQVLQPSAVDLGGVLSELTPMLRRTLSEDVDLRLDIDPTARPVRVDKSQLEQVIINLAFNARDAMPNGGVLTLSVSPAPTGAERGRRRPGSEVGCFTRLAVTDTGVGMDRTVAEHVFEPFYTTKTEGRGTGLGLATVHGIVAQSGGSIGVESEPGRGATFTILLPCADGPVAPPGDEAAGDPRGGVETVLLVEDEEHVRQVTARMLRGLGYSVIEVDRPSAALAIDPSRLETVDVLVTDVVLPDMSGTRLSAMLTRRSTRLRTLFVSGYAPDVALEDRVRAPHSAFQPKPFTRDQLAAAVRRVLDEPREQVLAD